MHDCRSVALGRSPAWAQYRETVIVDDSRDVLNEIMAIPASGIPASLLANAQGIVIIPDLVKGGFVLGVRHGRGIVMVRDERGFWRPPSFVTLTGGSVGWQIGLQVTDIVLVFKTRSSVQGLLRGKFTIGADAAAAAGPVGREAAAATDTQLLAEIFTWSRSRGLFAGVSLDGSALQIDQAANAAFYNGANVTDPNQAIPVPASAIALMRQVGYYTGTPGESLSATPWRPHRLERPLRRPAPPRHRRAPAAAGVADLQALGSNWLRPRSGCIRYSMPTGEAIWPCRPKSMPATVRPTSRACSRRSAALMPWPATRSMPSWPNGRSSAPRTNG